MPTSPTAHQVPLAEQTPRIVTKLPGPNAQVMLADEAPYISPSLIHVYPLMVRRASGCMVEDVDGNVFLDCEAGIAAASTGHCHPKIVEAVKAQTDVLIHMCGTDFHYPGYGELARRLAKHAPGDDSWQTFLTNSGTEAVEAALKLARYHTGRSDIIAFRGGFHGRSLGSLSLTASKTKYRRGFGPLLPGVHHATFPTGPDDDLSRVFESLETDLFGYTVPPDKVAAIVVEPIQGEGGYIIPPARFHRRLRELCDEYGIMLVYDEVQSGMGRAGKLFAAEHFDVIPDIITLAKGLATGFPLGAMVAKREVMTWPGGSHGSTCGGNPVCIAAALTTLDLLESELLENSNNIGRHLKDRLERALANVSIVEDVRGLGLMIGIELSSPDIANAVCQACYKRGLLVLDCGHKSIRMAPPLILTRSQADLAVDIFSAVCSDHAG
ncbi:MAG: aminotransferase class III-fold pyridoxal phosphate-dependent enzyme [Nannocystaceae bacterium]